MYNVQLLARRYSLSAKQVRDRLMLLDPVLSEHVLRGRNNAKLLTDSGLALFDRLIQLEREGIKCSSALKLLKEKNSNTGHNEEFNFQSRSIVTAELISALHDRVAEQKHIIRTLQDQVTIRVQANERLRHLLQQNLWSVNINRF